MKNMTGLFFGSFNPIHNGHLAIANYFINENLLNEVWFVVSPQNPLKNTSDLLDESHRLEITRKAVSGFKKLGVSDLEFSLPRPSFTIDTLQALSKMHPEREFVLLIGADSIDSFHLWKNFRKIVSDYRIFIYPRKDSGTLAKNYPDLNGTVFNEAPLFDVSSTEIRKMIRGGFSIKGLVPAHCEKLITEHYRRFEEKI